MPTEAPDTALPGPWASRRSADAGKLRLTRRFSIGEQLLDVGCSRGWYGREASGRGLRVAWTDIACNVEAPLRSRFALASCTALPYATDAFDTTLAFDVIEHVADEERAFAEVARVTRSRLILSLPNADDGVLSAYNLTYRHHTDKTHHREYTVEGVLERLSRLGFRSFRVLPAGRIRPDLSAEFLPFAPARAAARWGLRRLWHRGLLVDTGLHADIVVVADKVSGMGLSTVEGHPLVERSPA